MKRFKVSFTCALIGLTFSTFGQTDDKAVSTPAAQSDAAYTQTIEKRTADVLAALDLKDEAKTGAVHDAVMAHYRGLHDWQAANENRLNELAKEGAAGKAETEKITATRKTLHDEFIAKLAANLPPEQVEVVKDKLTYGKVKFTYQGYLTSRPDLTDAEKAKVLDMLKQAREEAIDGVSADEKTAIFKKYKGKINNYLSQQDKAAGDQGKSPK